MANPFIAGNVSDDDASTDLPVFKEYAWDFLHDVFVRDEIGQHKIVTENEALKVWIYKTLKTERWRYPVYDNVYGLELERFIGTRTNNEVSASEITQYITDALLVNPYIVTIDDIAATIDGDKLSYQIVLTTIYGQMEVTN